MILAFPEGESKAETGKESFEEIENDFQKTDRSRAVRSGKEPS